MPLFITRLGRVILAANLTFVAPVIATEPDPVYNPALESQFVPAMVNVLAPRANVPGPVAS